MDKRVFFVIIIIIILVSIFFIGIKIQGERMGITREKAIAIANKEALKLGYNIEVMDIKVIKYNVPWNDYLPKNSKSEYIVERQKKLSNKEYWTVYYGPKKMQFGGDLCIFIDVNTGEIITVYRGK